MNPVLSGRVPFTFFAPSDLSLGRLHGGTIEQMPQPDYKVKPASLIDLHTVAGKIHYKDLKDGITLKTPDGNKISVTVKNTKVSVDGAAIVNRDMLPIGSFLRWIPY